MMLNKTRGKLVFCQFVNVYYMYYWPIGYGEYDNSPLKIAILFIIKCAWLHL